MGGILRNILTKCEICGNRSTASGYCSVQKSVITYELNCGKEEVELNYERNVRNYKCEDCEATFQYKEPATSDVCGYCSQEHNISGEGTTTGKHNSVERHLICGMEETLF